MNNDSYPDKKVDAALEWLTAAEQALTKARAELHQLEATINPISTPSPATQQQKAAITSQPPHPATTFPTGSATRPAQSHRNMLPQNALIIQPKQKTIGLVHPPPVSDRIFRVTFNGSDTPPVPSQHSPWWTQEQNIIRLVGFFGAVVTFAGIAFLVSLGIERGLLGPTARVILSGILGIILLGAAIVMRNRSYHPAAITAALIASLLVLGVTDLALGFIMDLWPEIVATVCLVALIIGYAAIARGWKNENQAIALSIGSFALLLWHLYYQFEPQVFPYSLAGLALIAAAYQRPWKTADIIATILTVFGALLGDIASPHGHDIGVLLIAAILIVVILKAHVSVPVLLSLGTLSFTTPETFVLLLLVCLIWIAFDAGPAPLIILPIAFIPLAGSLYHSQRHWAFIALYLIVAASLFYFSYRPQKWFIWAIWIGCSIICSYQLAASVIFKETTSLPMLGSILMAVAITIMLISALINRKTIVVLPKPLPIILGLTGLYFSMLVIVTITMQITTTHGFLLGHAITSLTWIILAAVILIGRKYSWAIGITLAITASAKLVLYDMAALSGIPRVMAFLLSGLVLIIIATLRGKSAPQQPLITNSTPT